MSESGPSAEARDESRDIVSAIVAHNQRSDRRQHSTEIVHALFGPSVGPCVGDFSCHYHRHHGRLYASTNAVSFYSQLFGFERKLCWYLQDVVTMEAYRSTSVRITTIDSEEHVFRSFYNRDLVVQLLNQLKATGTVTPPLEISAPAGSAEEEQEDVIEELDEPVPVSPPRMECPGTSVRNDISRSFVSSLRESGKRLRSKSLSCLDKEKSEDAVTFPPTESDSSSVGTSENLLEAWEEILKSSADFKEVALDGLTLSCDLEQFFDLFLSDDAPFSMASYQEKEIGDYELNTTQWTEDGGTQVRTISFRHPLTKTFGMGPSSIHTTSHQRLRSFGQHGTCVETSSVIEGIPSADCFTVEDQWILQPNEKNGGITLSVKYEVRFSKRTFLKKMIQNSTRQETTEWYKGYADMLQSSLLTEGQPRKNRQETSLEKKDTLPTNESVPWGRLQKAAVGVLVVVLVAMLIVVCLLLLYAMRVHKLIASMQNDIQQLRTVNTELASQLKEALNVAMRQTQSDEMC